MGTPITVDHRSCIDCRHRRSARHRPLLRDRWRHTRLCAGRRQCAAQYANPACRQLDASGRSCPRRSPDPVRQWPQGRQRSCAAERHRADARLRSTPAAGGVYATLRRRYRGLYRTGGRAGCTGHCTACRKRAGSGTATLRRRIARLARAGQADGRPACAAAGCNVAAQQRSVPGAGRTASTGCACAAIAGCRILACGCVATGRSTGAWSSDRRHAVAPR